VPIGVEYSDQCHDWWSVEAINDNISAALLILNVQMEFSEERCGSDMPLNYVTMRLKGLFIIGKHEKTLNNQNPNPRRCNTKSLWAPLGLVG